MGDPFPIFEARSHLVTLTSNLVCTQTSDPPPKCWDYNYAWFMQCWGLNPGLCACWVSTLYQLSNISSQRPYLNKMKWLRKAFCRQPLVSCILHTGSVQAHICTYHTHIHTWQWGSGKVVTKNWVGNLVLRQSNQEKKYNIKWCYFFSFLCATFFHHVTLKDNTAYMK